MTDITEIWVENRPGQPALGIGESAPRLSWRISDDAATEFQIEQVAADGTIRSHRLPGSDTRLRAWPFPALRSREGVVVRIRAIGDGIAGEWSAPIAVEAGLLERTDWQVPFVSPSTSASWE